MGRVSVMTSRRGIPKGLHLAGGYQAPRNDAGSSPALPREIEKVVIRTASGAAPREPFEHSRRPAQEGG